ncbi:hypothetical protein PENANT_c127G09610 [Penicillium antarcticum]|uniref:Uncharacterized protein n=1 Tax=Penicillium antarcticum TaxID=416450 RepID=A0A1V6PGV0_9EURO|nr:hypothetical protein PENANT_c127G09610 [Penicillium antarcticum]
MRFIIWTVGDFLPKGTTLQLWTDSLDATHVTADGFKLFAQVKSTLKPLPKYDKVCSPDDDMSLDLPLLTFWVQQLHTSTCTSICRHIQS